MPIGIAGAAALAGGISAAGGLAGSGIEFAANKHLQEDAQRFTADENELNRTFNSAEAVKQRDWEKMMSDTSYQRQVADMIAAGINPAAIGMSGGAAVPNGSAARNNSSTTASSSRISVDSLFNSTLVSAFANSKSFRDEFVSALDNTASKVYKTQGFEHL